MKVMFLSLSLVLGMLSTSFSIPNEYSYQGRLTDLSGNPVPDGMYSIRLRLYGSSVGGSSIYDSGPLSVNVTDGLFAAVMTGVTFVLPDSTFLGITVGSDPEISPRTKFTKVPYAYISNFTETINQAGAGVVYGQFQVAEAPLSFASFKTEPIDRTIQTLSSTGALTSSIGGMGNGNFKLYNSTGIEMINMSGGSTKSTAELKRSTGIKAIGMDAQATGQGGLLTLTQSDNSTGATISSGDPSATQTSGLLSLHNNAGTAQIALDASTTGNNSVIFPADAVTAAEELNEPGIANAYKFNSVNINSSTDVRIDSVSISVPTSGFLVVTVSGYCDIEHTSGADTEGRVWTSTTGSLTFDNFTFFSIDNAQATESYYHHFSYTFVDDVIAGTLKYVCAADRTSSSGQFTVHRLHMTTQFFPTAYGSTVITTPPSPSVADQAPPDGGQIQLSQSRVTSLENHHESLRADIARIQDELNAALTKLLKLDEKK